MKCGRKAASISLIVLGGWSCAPEREAPHPQQQAAALAPRPSPSAHYKSPLPRASITVTMPASPTSVPSPSPSPLGPNEAQKVADRLDGIDRQFAPRADDLNAEISGKRQELAMVDASSKQQASQLDVSQRNRELEVQQNNQLLQQLSAKSAQEAELHERAALEIQRIMLNTAAPEDSLLMIDLRARLAREQQLAVALRSQSAQQLAAQNANTQDAVTAGSEQIQTRQNEQIELELDRNRLTAELQGLEQQLNQLNQEWKQARAQVAQQS